VHSANSLVQQPRAVTEYLDLGWNIGSLVPCWLLDTHVMVKDVARDVNLADWNESMVNWSCDMYV
jgi:hypothetical protein